MKVKIPENSYFLSFKIIENKMKSSYEKKEYLKYFKYLIKMFFFPIIYFFKSDKEKTYPELYLFDYYYNKFKDKIIIIEQPYMFGINYHFKILIDTKSYTKYTRYQIRTHGHIYDIPLTKEEEYHYEYVKLCKKELEN